MATDLMNGYTAYSNPQAIIAETDATGSDSDIISITGTCTYTLTTSFTITQ